MNKLLLLSFLIPGIIAAKEIDDTYWSYACEMYIYVFDTDKNMYKIYSRMNAESPISGKYISFQLTEGELHNIGPSLYSLSSADIASEIEANFGETGVITMQSPKYGYVALYPCDRKAALSLVNEANEYFEMCPKDIIKKCP